MDDCAQSDKTGTMHIGAASDSALERVDKKKKKMKKKKMGRKRRAQLLCKSEGNTAAFDYLGFPDIRCRDRDPQLFRA